MSSLSAGRDLPRKRKLQSIKKFIVIQLLVFVASRSLLDLEPSAWHLLGGFQRAFLSWGGEGGHYFFHFFSQTGKVVEELLEFKHSYLLTLELNWENVNSRCFDL